MPDIYIERDHQLGRDGARRVATRWQRQIEQKFDLRCHYEEGDDCDCLSFNGASASGTLTLGDDYVAIEATLGFFFSAFKDRVEQAMGEKLDELLAEEPPA